MILNIFVPKAVHHLFSAFLKNAQLYVMNVGKKVTEKMSQKKVMEKKSSV